MPLFKKGFWTGNGYTDNIKQRSGRYHKIVKYLEASDLLINRFNKTIKNQAK